MLCAWLINIYCCYTADQKRISYMKLSCETKLLRQFDIKREDVYNGTLKVYSNAAVLDSFPARFRFEGEIAVDQGGVSRDLFSAFWKEAFQELFDGTTLLSPINYPGLDFDILPTVGTILSHGYLVCGFFPIRLAFPCIVRIIQGQVVIPDWILLRSFVDSLNSHESSILKDAFAVKDKEESFSSSLKQSLLGILSRYGCRNLPSPRNLSKLVLDAVKYEFVIKPCAALTAMRAGIPSKHQVFWESMSVEELYELYQALSASPAKVLALIEDSVELQNPNEERVLSYLKQFIGTMNSDEIRVFLRFVTGSSVCPSECIKITFNSLSGFARRPISHTCDYCLELPISYRSSIEFINEFRSILSSSEYLWYMDGI